MACISHKPRTATVVADGPAVVLEVTRNMLLMLQRNRSSWEVLDRFYRQRAIFDALGNSDLFDDLTADQMQQLVPTLASRAEFKRVVPGAVIVREGDADDKSVYLLRTGFVKVSRRSADGQEHVLTYIPPGGYFGEIALVRNVPRTATCSAIDEVEVVRIQGDVFRDLLRDYPAVLASVGLKIDERTARTKKPAYDPAAADQVEYMRQGLFQGQKMLILDLESCTRCDECTRACADAHGDGTSRLLREGLRLGSFLVATSCRSCHHPYCMERCPVDAIHRDGKTKQIRIDAHCIGCSLCEKNCPYDAIQMVEKVGGRSAVTDDRSVPLPDGHPLPAGRQAAVEMKAVNCDLCHGLVPDGHEPFCVRACPHHAAFRWDGPKLLGEVAKRR